MARSAARERGIAFGSLALGSLIGLLLATQGGWAPAIAPVLAGAAAAGTGLAALSGRYARTALGVLIVVLGAGMVVAAVLAPGTVLRWSYLGCGVLVIAGAGVLLLKARSWPQRPDRYARLRARSTTTAEDDSAEVWKAMDAGFDPTTVRPETESTGRNASDRGE